MRCHGWKTSNGKRKGRHESRPFLNLSPPRFKLTSILPDHRAAPAIVDASSDRVSILADAVVPCVHAGDRKHAREGVVLGAYEQMVVFDGGRPIRSKAIFNTSTNCSAPARCGRTVKDSSGSSEKALVFVVGNSSAALCVYKGIVPGKADLAGEQAEGVEACAVGGSGRRQARVRPAQICPVALRFQTVDESAALPAISHLTARRAAGRIVATFGRGRNNSDSESCGIGIAIVARSPAAVGADVEAAPVIDRSDHRGCLGVRTGCKIGSRGGRSETQRNQPYRTQQKLLHPNLSSSYPLRLVPEAFSISTAETIQLMAAIYRFKQVKPSLKYNTREGSGPDGSYGS